LHPPIVVLRKRQFDKLALGIRRETNKSSN
jgi:hypothetical protein